MGLIDKIKTQNKLTEVNNPPLFSKDNLSKVEVAFILTTLKNTTFKGNNVELLYNLIIKLQNQYTKLDKNV